MHFNFDEYPGIEYFFQTIKVYLETFSIWTELLLVGYVILLIYVLIKGTKAERLFYFGSLITLIIICLNPWMARYLVDNWGFSERYFRLFWIIPVSLGYAYFFSKLYEGKNGNDTDNQDETEDSKQNVIENKDGVQIRKNIIRKKILFFFAICLFIFSCEEVVRKSSRLYLGTEEKRILVPVSNIYKVEDDVVAICEMIEEDAGDKEAIKMAAFEKDFFIESRTYDASIAAMFPYGTFPLVNLQDAIKNEDWKGALGDLMSGKLGGTKRSYVTTSVVRKVATRSGCQYVIISKKNKFYKKWIKSLTVLGESGRYTLLKVE